MSMRIQKCPDCGRDIPKGNWGMIIHRFVIHNIPTKETRKIYPVEEKRPWRDLVDKIPPPNPKKRRHGGEPEVIPVPE